MSVAPHCVNQSASVAPHCVTQSLSVAPHRVTPSASVAPCLMWGATDAVGVTRCGVTDADGVTQCGATDADRGTSITRISAVSAYLKLKEGKNEILTNLLGTRNPNPLIYGKIVFLDRVPLSQSQMIFLRKTLRRYLMVLMRQETSQLTSKSLR